MNFDKFVKMLTCKVQMYLGTEYEVVEHKVTKNNSVELTGLMAKKKGASAFPTFYVDDFYDSKMKDEDLEYLAMKLAKGLENARMDESLCVEEFVEYDKARRRIVFKLISADRNKELLLDVPHRRVHNLAVVYMFVIDNEIMGTRGSILIRNSHLESWKASEEDLYNDAYENTRNMFPPKEMDIFDIIEEMGGPLPEHRDENSCRMIVLSNEAKLYGATSILYPEVLSRISDKLDNSFYILPSSVHEVIIVPQQDDINPANLVSMVTEVNSTQVGESDILADSLYFYDKENEDLRWLC